MIAGDDTRRREVRGGLTLALHASRSPSPASELEAIETILAIGGADGETATVKQIAAQTGLSVQTVRRRLRLRSLIADLRQAFDEGLIAASVAEAAARLPEAQQQALVRHHGEAAGLTLARVREQSCQQTGAATAELPDELFAERMAGWQTTVRGHLLAAVEAIPDEPNLAGVRGFWTRGWPRSRGCRRERSRWRPGRDARAHRLRAPGYRATRSIPQS